MLHVSRASWNTTVTECSNFNPSCQSALHARETLKANPRAIQIVQSQFTFFFHTYTWSEDVPFPTHQQFVLVYPPGATLRCPNRSLPHICIAHKTPLMSVAPVMKIHLLFLLVMTLCICEICCCWLWRRFSSSYLLINKKTQLWRVLH